jgi:hypothetical protein
LPIEHSAEPAVLFCFIFSVYGGGGITIDSILKRPKSLQT